MRIFDTLAAIVVTVGAILYLLDTLAIRWGLNQQYIATRYPDYLKAAQVSLYVTTISYFVGMGIGFVLGWARSVHTLPLAKVIEVYRRTTAAAADGGRAGMFPIRAILVHGVKYYLKRIADAYVAIIRGTPLFVQIIFAWSVIITYSPRMDLTLQGLLAGILALTVNTGGYQSEIFRAGITTVHSGQVEAASNWTQPVGCDAARHPPPGSATRDPSPHERVYRIIEGQFPGGHRWGCDRADDVRSS